MELDATGCVPHLLPVIHNAGIACGLHAAHSVGACFAVCSPNGEELEDARQDRHADAPDDATAGRADDRRGPRAQGRTPNAEGRDLRPRSAVRASDRRLRQRPLRDRADVRPERGPVHGRAAQRRRNAPPRHGRDAAQRTRRGQGPPSRQRAAGRTGRALASCAAAGRTRSVATTARRSATARRSPTASTAPATSSARSPASTPTARAIASKTGSRT